MPAQAAKRPRYRSNRGYRAEVIAMVDDRVIYDAWDEAGEQIQRNGCRTPAAFFADWAA